MHTFRSASVSLSVVCLSACLSLPLPLCLSCLSLSLSLPSGWDGVIWKRPELNIHASQELGAMHTTELTSIE